MRYVGFLCAPVLLWVALYAEESVKKDGKPQERRKTTVTFNVRLVEGDVEKYLPGAVRASKGVEVDEETLADLLKKISADRQIDSFVGFHLSAFSGQKAEASFKSARYHYIAEYEGTKGRDGLTGYDPVLKTVQDGTQVWLAGVPHETGGLTIKGQIEVKAFREMKTEILKMLVASTKNPMELSLPVEKPEFIVRRKDLNVLLSAKRSSVFLVTSEQDRIERPVYAILSATVLDPPDR